MKLFYDSINVKEKYLVHFNEFMLNIHRDIHRENKNKVIYKIIK